MYIYLFLRILLIYGVLPVQVLDFKGIRILLITGKLQNKMELFLSSTILHVSYRTKVFAFQRPAGRKQVTEEQERPGVIQVNKKDHSKGPIPGNSLLVSRVTGGGEE